LRRPFDVLQHVLRLAPPLPFKLLEVPQVPIVLLLLIVVVSALQNGGFALTHDYALRHARGQSYTDALRKWGRAQCCMRTIEPSSSFCYFVSLTIADQRTRQPFATLCRRIHRCACSPASSFVQVGEPRLSHPFSRDFACACVRVCVASACSTKHVERYGAGSGIFLSVNNCEVTQRFAQILASWFV
jgi:hypothetical protein